VTVVADAAVFDETRPLAFAHRGGAALRPENTLLAFDHGLSVGADGLEFDVRLSRDGVVMVHHDATLERTTNGIGAIASCSADTLSHLDAAFHFRGIDGDRYMGRGYGVPRLDEVLARYPGVPLILELKGTDPRLAQRAVETVRAARALSHVCFGGFSARMLREVRRVAPDVWTSAAKEEIRWFLYRSWVGLAPERTSYRALQVPETAGRVRVVSERFVQAATRATLPVHVWTVDSPTDMERLLGWGVRGIISDRPDLAAQVIRRWRTPRSAASSAAAATASE
jgi:glycerophosphoryl diester phosphodiesterase